VACTEKVCLDIADVVRDGPTILRKKIGDLDEAGATSLDAAAFSGIANWLAVL